jgi:hypothetical protein
MNITSSKPTRLTKYQDEKYSLKLMNEDSLLLTEEQAAKIMNSISSNNPPKFIQIGSEIFAVHQIVSLKKLKTFQKMVSVIPEEQCSWCKQSYRGAWSQHASKCGKNPYKKEAQIMLEKTNPRYNPGDISNL